MTPFDLPQTRLSRGSLRQKFAGWTFISRIDSSNLTVLLNEEWYFLTAILGSQEVRKNSI